MGVGLISLRRCSINSDLSAGFSIRVFSSVFMLGGITIDCLPPPRVLARPEVLSGSDFTSEIFFLSLRYHRFQQDNC